MNEFNHPKRLEFDVERRKYPRAAVESEVAMEFSGQEYVLVAKEISAGGLRTSPHDEIPESSEGIITLTVGDDRKPVSCRCRVIYSIDGRGIGVEFLDLSDASRQVLIDFVDESN